MFKFLGVLCAIFAFSYGMDCSLGTSKNALDQLISSCPRPLIDSSDEQYCCPSGDSFKCCTLSNYLTEWLMYLWPFILLVIIVLVVMCVVCFCLRQIRSLCC